MNYVRTCPDEGKAVLFPHRFLEEKMLSETELSQLSGTELVYELLKSQGIEVFGERQGPFSIASRTKQELLVFGGNEHNVKHISFDDDDAFYPLEVAQRLGANFSVEGETVTCSIGKTITTGKSYCEAAMRGLIAHRVASCQKV